MSLSKLPPADVTSFGMKQEMTILESGSNLSCLGDFYFTGLRTGASFDGGIIKSKSSNILIAFVLNLSETAKIYSVVACLYQV
jgi:hypothetical protein